MMQPTVSNETKKALDLIFSKPTPYSLYHNSREKKLLALGYPMEDATIISTREYTTMSDEQKHKWILLSVEKTPAYIVSHLLS